MFVKTNYLFSISIYLVVMPRKISHVEVMYVKIVSSPIKWMDCVDSGIKHNDAGLLRRDAAGGATVVPAPMNGSTTIPSPGSRDT